MLRFSQFLVPCAGWSVVFTVSAESYTLAHHSTIPPGYVLFSYIKKPHNGRFVIYMCVDNLTQWTLFVRANVSFNMTKSLDIFDFLIRYQQSSGFFFFL